MLNQIRFTARLKLVSDLHIGTGERGPLELLRPEANLEKDALEAQVALVVRGVDGYPVIPATALKGALRKAVRAAHGKDVRDRLFGKIKGTTWQRVRGEDVAVDSGQAGCVWLRFATMTETPVFPGAAPFWDADRSTIITTHVAIDDRTGTAAAQKLFHVERVPAGAVFELRGTYIGGRVEAEQDLPLAFAALANVDGLGLGANDKQGYGRLRLDREGELDCTCWWFDPTSGDIRNDHRFKIAVTPGAPMAPPPVALDLFCRGPYLTIDPSKPRAGDNQIHAARRNDDAPVLAASSLLGVLRNRAAWLNWPVSTEGIERRDDTDDNLASGESPARLTSTQRLFGVAGWRGLVRVVSITSTACARECLPGVAIDRFSGATLDSALYETEAFVGARFAVVLRLDRRWAGGVLWPSNADSRLFASLIEDLYEEGLLLGHGVNRGYGWFEVKEA